MIAMEKSKRLKVYISGPMRGIERYGFPAFDEARDLLLRQRYDVISPADLDRARGFDPRNLPKDHDWQEMPVEFDLEACIIQDIKSVLSCDCIVMLSGWEGSSGATSELATALWAGKTAYTLVGGVLMPLDDQACASTVVHTGNGNPDDLFPEDAEERKEYPVFSGLLEYFPHACAAVAHHSYGSNNQHNPGEPLHWAKEKSIGSGDQIIRHIMEGHLVAVAWRALELLERKLTGLPPFEDTHNETQGEID